MEHTKGKKKSTNPLSKARKQMSAQEQLWFRRTGAGFHLFIQYYGELFPPLAEAPKAVEKRKPVPSGQSRAAKRRRKRKGLTDESVPVKEEQEETTTSHRLSTTFQQYQQQYPHLKHLIESLSRPLPVTFRLRQTSDIPKLQKLLRDFSMATPFAWNPHIYQTKIPKYQLSNYPDFQKFLLDFSQNGSIARQELGSILPVWALQHMGVLRKGARVLDMCASPGSKTLQALEVIGSKGKIYANDVSESRIQALKEAIQRSAISDQLQERIVYSCQDASQLVFRKKKPLNAIICDVPCSGDGTIRKDKHILPMFTPQIGASLFNLQVRILVRALELCPVVCYSTCTLNPVENEGVVQAALDRVKFTVKVVPLDLGIRLRPGWTTWKTADYVDEDEIPRLDWHPEVQAHHELQNCLRLYPSDNDSGGFFLALLKRSED